MERTSRAEGQARTRAHLIEVARELFVREGFAATSLARVATEAGYTKGAVYSNFAGKQELGLAVLAGIRNAHAAEIASIISAERGTFAEHLARFDAWAERTIGDPVWVALEIEYVAAIRRDASALEGLAAQNAQLRGVLASTVTYLVDRFGLATTRSPQDVADTLLSLGVGVGVLRALDPTLPVRIFTDAVHDLARADPAAAVPRD